jgi:polar amino acid transport system substrate-binding protein
VAVGCSFAQQPLPNRRNEKFVNYIKLGQRVMVVLLLGLFSNAHGQDGAQDKDVLTIFVDSSYPPYMYALEGTVADGLYPRLVQEVVNQAGEKVAIKAYPWKRALIYSEEGKGAVAGAYKNAERLKFYDYSNSLYQEKLVVFVNKNKSFEFNSIADLEGKVVGVNRGWSYGQEFDDARANKLFDVNIRNHPDENFKMLALGRIDCLILDKQSGDSFIKLMGIKDQIVSLPYAFSVNDGYLIVPKTMEMADFIAKFNASLEQIRKDGTYNQIVKTYIQGKISE